MVLAYRPGQLRIAAALPVRRTGAGEKPDRSSIKARLRAILYNSSDDGLKISAAGEPSCRLWRESRQKSRGVLYGKTLIH
jgi:hypothetical protein